MVRTPISSCTKKNLFEGEIYSQSFGSDILVSNLELTQWKVLNYKSWWFQLHSQNIGYSWIIISPKIDFPPKHVELR